MDEAIEGIDYIFDRYSYLGLDPTASEQAIKTEIRKKRAENHPDKLSRVSAEIQAVAARTIELIDQCEKVLLNAEVRTLYDEKLAQFQTKEPYLISTNGVAKIDPTRFRINLDYLLNEPVADFKELEAKAMQLSGFNEKKLIKLRTRYQETPEFEEREELREMLTNKLVFLNIIEDFYWQKAGINGGHADNENYRLQHPDELAAAFEDKLKKIESQTQEAIEKRHGVFLIGLSSPLLLTYNGQSLVYEKTNEQAVVQAVVKQFQARSEDLKRLIKEKQEVMEELVTVSRHKQIKKADNSLYAIFMVANSDIEIDEFWPGETVPLLNMAFLFNKDSGSIESLTYSQPELTGEYLALLDYNVYVVQPNAEIGSPLMEITALAEKIMSES